ncbi:glycerophosphodiester phosphodiesterase [Ornithinicoccus halotolerans]|uniref:glycerophosphodiester phosphodiesterase n=1 Tax=Ornithinicoccus halotolerans TaxID=1748220 RepID=UPI0012975E4E|nr:glycerophosphodiester phosphodiesterase [Ornithinicoccus halotolerans]
MPTLPYLDHPGPVPLAHRGFSSTGLENSRAAFAAAVELGYRYLETDVHATADGMVVAFHDTRLDRVTDRQGAVAALPWAEVARARIGGMEPVPSLAELLEEFPAARFNIDIKAPAAVTPLAELLERTRSHDRVCVTSFSDRRRLAALRRLSRPVATSAGQAVVGGLLAVQRLPPAARAPVARRLLAGVHLLQVPEQFGRVPVLTPAVLATVHAAGVGVHVWTVNDRATMVRLLDAGVDGLVTDRADLLKDVLRERGEWV